MNLKNFLSSRISILLVSCFVILSIFIIGIHLDFFSSNVQLPALYKGLINGFKIRTLYIYEHYWGELFYYLYSKNIHIPWHGIMLTFYSLISILFCLRFCYLVFKEKWDLLEFSMQVLLLLLFLPSIFWIDITRCSMLIVGTIIAIISVEKAERLSLKELIFYGFFFITAYWIRPESGKVAMVMVLPMAIIIAYFKKEAFIKKMVIQLVFISLSFMSVFVHTRLYQSQDDEVMRKMYKLHFAYFDAYIRNESLSSNPADSIRLKAMSLDFSSDKDSLNLNVYEKLTFGETPSLINTINYEERFQRVNDFFSLLIYSNKGIVLAYIILLAFLFFSHIRNKRLIAYLVLGQVYALGCIVTIVFLFKAVERSYEPMISLAGLIMVMGHQSNGYKTKMTFLEEIKTIIISTLVLLSVIMCFEGWDTKLKRFNKLELRNRHIVMSLSSINRKSTDLIFNNSALLVITFKPLEEVNPENFIIHIHDAHFNYLPGMDNALIRYSGSPSLISFYQYLATKNKNHILVSNDENIQLLKDYFRIIYKMDFVVNELKISNYPIDFYEKPEVKLFKITQLKSIQKEDN